MGQTDLSLVAHLLRRAGFGATHDELETYALQSYEETVEELRKIPVKTIHEPPWPVADDGHVFSPGSLRATRD